MGKNRRKKRKLNMNSTGDSGGFAPDISGDGSMATVIHSCPVCNNEVDDDVESIQCFRCDKWVHFHCSDLSQEKFQTLRESTDCIQYFCEGCVIKNRTDKENLTSGTATQSNGSLDAKMDIMLKKLEALETKISTLENHDGPKLDKKIKTVVDRELAAAFDERDEIDRRKRNVIVFGLSESMGDNETMKLRYDIERIRTMMNKIEPELGNIKLIDPVRIHTKKKDKPRLIKFKVETEDLKERIVKGSIRVNKGLSIENRVYFNNDFTPKQRESHKVLKQKLEDKKKETGEDDWVIKRGEVVKAKKTTQEHGTGQGNDSHTLQTDIQGKASGSDKQKTTNQSQKNQSGNRNHIGNQRGHSPRDATSRPKGQGGNSSEQ